MVVVVVLDLLPTKSTLPLYYYSAVVDESSAEVISELCECVRTWKPPAYYKACQVLSGAMQVCSVGVHGYCVRISVQPSA